MREQKSQELRKIQGVCEWKKRSMRKKQYVTREVELSEMLEAYERKWYHRPLYGKDAEKHFPKTTDVPSHPKQWNMVPPVQSPSLPPSSSFRSPTLFMSEEIPDSNSPAGKGSGKTTPAVIAALDQVDRKVHVPQTLILCPKTENVNEVPNLVDCSPNFIRYIRRHQIPRLLRSSSSSPCFLCIISVGFIGNFMLCGLQCTNWLRSQSSDFFSSI